MQATKLVAELARGMTRLRGFVHVSTAYTNCDHPKRAVVHERVYPLLAASGKPLDIDAIAAELASLPPAAAEARVRTGPRAAGVSLHALLRFRALWQPESQKGSCRQGASTAWAWSFCT